MDIVTIFQKLSRQTVSKRVGGSMFRDSGRLDCVLDCFLNHGLIEVVAALIHTRGQRPAGDAFQVLENRLDFPFSQHDGQVFRTFRPNEGLHFPEGRLEYFPIQKTKAFSA